MKLKVSVTTSAEYPVSMAEVKNVFGDRAIIEEVNMPFRKLLSEEIPVYIEKLKDSNGILVRAGVFEKELLKGLDSLQIIGVHGAGYDQIDINAAAKLGIAVVNAPGANAVAATELTFGLILCAQRQLFSSMSELKNNKDWILAKKNGRELSEKKLGLLGLGRIGFGVATRARAFGMEILAYDPYFNGQLENTGITLVNDIESIFKQADIISLHMPLSDETKHIINTKSLSMMKQHCIIVNASRGELINEQDLCNALKANTIGGAALDVFEAEPPEANSELYSLPNVIMTPHIGGSTFEALDKVARMAATDMHRFLVTNEQVKQLVNSPETFKKIS